MKISPEVVLLRKVLKLDIFGIALTTSTTNLYLLYSIIYK